MENAFYGLDLASRVALVREARERGEPLLMRWSEIQPGYGDRWEPRAALAAAWLATAHRIADLGCGSMNLERHLGQGQRYVPVDLAPRDDRTIVLDVNRAPDLARLPAADACALLGVLEYAYAPDVLLAAVRDRYAQTVVSFNVREEGDDLERRVGNAWVNHWTRSQLVQLFVQHRLLVVRERVFEGPRHEHLFELRKNADVRT